MKSISISITRTKLGLKCNSNKRVRVSVLQILAAKFENAVFNVFKGRDILMRDRNMREITFKLKFWKSGKCLEIRRAWFTLDSYY